MEIRDVSNFTMSWEIFFACSIETILANATITCNVYSLLPSFSNQAEGTALTTLGIAFDRSEWFMSVLLFLA